MQDIIKTYNELAKENWLITKLAIMQEIESFDDNYFEFLKENDISLDNFLNFIIHGLIFITLRFIRQSLYCSSNIILSYPLIWIC